MDAKEFIALLDANAVTLAAQTAAQEAHAGKSAAITEAAAVALQVQRLADLRATALAKFDAASAALDESSEALALGQERLDAANILRAAALASKANVAAAEKAHADASAPIAAFLAQRPAAVDDGVVLGHGDPKVIAFALRIEAELVIPKTWPTVFPAAARLLYADGVVTVDPSWEKAAKIADLEAELSRIEAAAKRPDELRALIATIKNEGG